MFESNLDIFFIVILILAVLIILGMNIVSIIDKKISNVTVNVPPPNVIVNIQKRENGQKEIEKFQSVDVNVNSGLPNVVETKELKIDPNKIVQYEDDKKKTT